MAFPTTNMRVETGSGSLFAVGIYPDPALESGADRAGDLCTQLHEFAGICHANPWNRAGATQIPFPG